MPELDPTAETSRDDGSSPTAPPVVTTGADAAPKRRSRAGTFFIGLFSGCLLVVAGLIAIMLLGFFGSDTSEFVPSTSKVAVIPIEGEIVDARDTIDLLHKYADSSMVRAIVVRINSPGGAIAPSQEIYEAIRTTRKESGKPIVASLDSVAASGGFYIAAACDRIVSNPGSITGSIGVILEWMEVKDLLEWAKIKPQTITAGALKATGSPFKDMTEQERTYLTAVVDQLHGQFIRAVAEGRAGKISAAEVAKIADGRIFTGEQALSLKLVDQLGSLDDAVALAGKLAGIHGRPVMIYPKRRGTGWLDLLTGTDARSSIEQILSRRAPRILYRW